MTDDEIIKTEHYAAKIYYASNGYCFRADTLEDFKQNALLIKLQENKPKEKAPTSKVALYYSLNKIYRFLKIVYPYKNPVMFTDLIKNEDVEDSNYFDCILPSTTDEYFKSRPDKLAEIVKSIISTPERQERALDYLSGATNIYGQHGIRQTLFKHRKEILIYLYKHNMISENDFKRYAKLSKELLLPPALAKHLKQDTVSISTRKLKEKKKGIKTETKDKPLSEQERYERKQRLKKEYSIIRKKRIKEKVLNDPIFQETYKNKKRKEYEKHKEYCAKHKAEIAAYNKKRYEQLKAKLNGVESALTE